MEDDDCFEVAGHDTVYRRFGHTVGRVPVLTDQWLWVVDGVGHQLVGTVAAAEYEDYCDVFESVAETFDPDADRTEPVGMSVRFRGVFSRWSPRGPPGARARRSRARRCGCRTSRSRGAPRP